jgi:hypothetical protein
MTEGPLSLIHGLLMWLSELCYLSLVFRVWLSESGRESESGCPSLAT